MMTSFFFSGSTETKIDEKNRFVLPQQMRYGLVENGELEFYMALGLGGSVSIYRKSDMDKIVEAFKKKQHVAKYQKFMTLFFSTLHKLSCDKLGRVVMPLPLKKIASIENEIVVCGVLNKIEIWPANKFKEKFEDENFTKMAEETFALLDEGEPDKAPFASLTEEEKAEYQEL